jgi:hypothetical protein
MKRRRGSALLEAGLSLLVLVPILAGVIQLGYAFRLYSRLESSLHNAARYGSRRPVDGECAARTRNEIRNMVLYGHPAPPAAAVPLVAGLQPDHVLVDYEVGPLGRPTGLVVRISGYELESLFGRFPLHGRPLVAAPVLAVGACTPREKESPQ